MTSAVQQVVNTPELLEKVLQCLLDDVVPLSNQEDPRSLRTNANATSILNLLHCMEVCQAFNATILGSKALRRASFLAPEARTSRAWSHAPQSNQTQSPILNPVIQTTFPAYHYRFWHLSVEVSGNRYCAYLIITRRDLEQHRLHHRRRLGHGRSISKMLLSQPPILQLEARIWEERDESKEYVGRTLALKEPIVECQGGLTIGMVHERAAEMFAEHRDVAAIKLTTV
ncbi:hypothetical protein Tdes44962_MAKER02553 [Teratosphaeria destructans]|uniref:Uncharacterized protein n=1 Tax=Teratosphaeria destructans TaxID=418781 RepID=A0A9W7W387_9PEZI|nr:hypothetical protein Tdes44962_MAKER02553 [Teratosphaeria destructans]